MKQEFKFYIPLAVSFVLPALLSGNQLYTLLLTDVVLNSMLAVSFDLLAGYAALDNLAVGGLASMGAYVMAYMMMHYGVNFFLTVPLAGLAAAALGMALVYPSLRIKGVYFAISTIIVQVVLTQLFTDWIGFTGGEEGIFGIPRPSISFGGHRIFITGTPFVYISLVLLVIWLIVVRKLTTGGNGMKMLAIRDDDVLASHLGLNLARQRLKIFFISSFVMGVYGAMSAPLTTYVSPDVWNVIFSFDVLIMVYLGGRGTTWGPIIGATILTLLPNLFNVFYTFREFVTGLLLILVIVVLPGGIYSIFEKIRERSSNRIAKAPEIKG